MSEVCLSVALVTRNRPESLNRCLKSLRSQKFQPFEVIVSDDSDPDLVPQTEAVARQWGCHYISGPHRGLYANRNHVVKACRGTHIRTMDDDHEFPKDHFEKVQQRVKSDPSSVWIIGEFLPTDMPSFPVAAPGEIQPRGFSNIPPNADNCYAISDGASVYPKQIFEHHSYLEVYKFGKLYLEFGARLKALGYTIRHIPDTYVVHHYVEGKRSFNDERMKRKSEFIASYLAYSCYLPNLARSTECFSYFLMIALLTTIKVKNCSLTMFDFWQTWQLGRRYKNAFQAGKYSQLI